MFQRIFTLLANLLWIALSLPDAVRWWWATGNVAATQAAVRRRIRHPNRATLYASRVPPRSVPHPQSPIPKEHYPLTQYADYAPFIERIAAGEPNVLAAEPVLLLEPTSGSTGQGKLIPYTASLKREFQRGIGPWVVHTFLRHPALFLGKAYWSVTPVIETNRRSSGGIPIGFEEESEYFGRLESKLVGAVMAVPPQVKQITHMESFRYVSLLFLLACPNLRLVSVWNPTFFTLLLAPLKDEWPRLVNDIRQGTISPPVPLSADLHGALLAQFHADPERAHRLDRIFATTTDPAARHRQIWPNLILISCWADANAAPYAKKLAQIFPQASLQPKGLLSTEGFVSLPFAGQPTTGEPGHALSLHSHFYEFIPVTAANHIDIDAMGVDAMGLDTMSVDAMGANKNSSGNKEQQPALAHELALHQQYEVVLTTGGGLVRYATGDVVQVVGFFRQCPLFRFMGRRNIVSDWFGEKLHEAHVGQVLGDAFAQLAIQPRFSLLACETTLNPSAYVLFLEFEQDIGDVDLLGQTLTEDLPLLQTEVEQGLQQNVHYAYCRQLGQLGEVTVQVVQGDAEAIFLARCVAEGQRLGDIKPATLDRRSGWMAHFMAGQPNI